jgi:hypothetical protein
VAGRSRTCGAPRFRRALYRAELRPRDGRGWDRTSGFLFVREALSLAELHALESGPGGSRTRNRRPLLRGGLVVLRVFGNYQPARPLALLCFGPTSSGTRTRTSIRTLRTCRPAVRRSRKGKRRRRPHRCAAAQSRRITVAWSGWLTAADISRGDASPGSGPRLSVHLPAGDRRSGEGFVRVPWHAGTSRAMLSKPLAYSSTLDRRCRRPTWRSFGARRAHVVVICVSESSRECSALFSALDAGAFLSQAEPRFRPIACSS